MRRLIYLDAAVDVVAKWFENIGLNGDICLDGLRSLPSVQPEPCTDAVSRRAVVSRISDLIVLELHGERLPTWNEVYRAIEELPSAPTEPQWIPCSETVDIPDHEIMACDKYGEIMLGYLAYEDDQWLCASDGCMMYDPIAWREKPEPYRGEGD